MEQTVKMFNLELIQTISPSRKNITFDNSNSNQSMASKSEIIAPVETELSHFEPYFKKSTKSSVRCWIPS